MEPRPPRHAEWLLSRCISPNLRYRAIGDFAEIHADIHAVEGPRAADRWYWRQVARSLPFFVLDTLYWTLIMFKNYFRTATRNLLKNRATTIVNAVGLSVAIATAITAFLFIEKHYTMDRFHENGAHIFLAESVLTRGNRTNLVGNSPMRLGPVLKADVPQVEQMARIAFGTPTFQRGDATFQEWMWYADASVLSMFSFELRLGNPESLEDMDAIILSDALAEKYFGSANPIGQEILVNFTGTDIRPFTVTGVAAPFPNKASFTFNAIINIGHLEQWGMNDERWTDVVSATFVQVADPGVVSRLTDASKGYADQYNAVATDRRIERFEYQNLRTLSRSKYDVSNIIVEGSHPAAVIVLGIVALFMLALSCINYINLSVASAAGRLKEVGVRKTVGSTRGQIALQFLSENVVLCMGALVAGTALAALVFVPGFNTLFDFVGGSISFADAETRWLWLFLGALLLLTGVVSGAYPSLYVSSFSITGILKGRTTLGGENLLTRGMLTVQFVLAFLTVFMGLVLAQNASYQANRDWGYDNDHILIASVRSVDEMETLRSEVEKLPGVMSMAGSSNAFNRSWSRPTVTVDTDEVLVAGFDLSPEFLDVYAMDMVAGEGFKESSNTLVDGEILISRLFADSRGWLPEDAVGRSIQHDSLTYAVAGVVENFNYRGIYDPIEPAFIRAVARDRHRFLSIRVAEGSGQATEAAIQDIWKRLFPTREYNVEFEDTTFREVMTESRNIRTLFSIVAAIALIIASMGLFGLAAQRIARRTREISIRKIMGASTADLAGRVHGSLLAYIVVAAAIAMPVAYLAMDALLHSVYASPVPLGPLPAVVAVLTVLLTSTLTVSSLMGRLTRMDPASVLRTE